MKGVELPINVIVIVVLCLVVLLAIIALFFGVWNPGKSSITLEAAKTNACQMLVSMGCNSYPKDIFIHDFDANKNGKLKELGGISDPDNDGTWSIADNCESAATINGVGDNLAALCVCYYSKFSENDCKKLCGCT